MSYRTCPCDGCCGGHCGGPRSGHCGGRCGGDCGGCCCCVATRGGWIIIYDANEKPVSDDLNPRSGELEAVASQVA